MLIPVPEGPKPVPTPPSTPVGVVELYGVVEPYGVVLVGVVVLGFMVEGVVVDGVVVTGVGVVVDGVVVVTGVVGVPAALIQEKEGKSHQIFFSRSN